MDPAAGQFGLRHSPTSARTNSLVIISSKAGSITPKIEAKIRRSFARSLIVEFDPTMDIDRLISPRATVVIAGGDGTIGWAVRRLVDTKHPLGILSMGTFNNFAKSLHLPTTIDAAIRVITGGGAPRPVTLGRVNGHVFLEAAAIGLFGATIAAGDAAKDLAFGEFSMRVKQVMTARPFKYELVGDIRGSGSVRSLVFTNTPSTGAHIAVSRKTPENPYLELTVHAGASRTDIVRRVLRPEVASKIGDEGLGQTFRFSKLEVVTKPKVHIYTDNFRVGRTPASITAELSALRVILPR